MVREYIVGRMSDAYKDKVRRTRARRIERNRAIAVQAKSVPCVDCRQTFPHFCMDFDHVRGEKEAEVSLLACKSTSPERLLNEIAKCDAVCANCHRIRTFIKRDHAALCFGGEGASNRKSSQPQAPTGPHGGWRKFRQGIPQEVLDITASRREP